MAFINVAVGQGGNQISSELWGLIKNEFPLTDEIYFRNQRARAILIDTEPKQSGRGNCWGYGYYDLPKKQHSLSTQESLLERSMQCIRKEAENCDDFEGMFLTHSLGGGTGSGFGSHILEQMRDEYPRHFIISGSLMPFLSGDTPLQSYNCVFSLAWLQEFADGIILFQNDQIMDSIGKFFSFINKEDGAKIDPKKTCKVGIQDMNMYIASCLSGTFFPLSPQGTSFFSHEKRKAVRFGDFVTTVCPLPSNKFVEIQTAPFLSTRKIGMNTSWREIAGALARMSNRYYKEQVMYTSSGMVIARGDDDTFRNNYRTFGHKLDKTFPCVSWNPYALDIRISKFPGLKTKEKMQRTITICANRNNLGVVENMLENAVMKFEAKAYLHWYQRYGCEEQLFIESFECIRNIIDSYKKINYD